MLALLIDRIWYYGGMKKTAHNKSANPFLIEFERETDKRWIAEVPRLPGVMVYGRTKKEARQKLLTLFPKSFLSKSLHEAQRGEYEPLESIR